MQIRIQPSLGTVFILLTCLQALGLHLFLKGFLLSRQTFDLQGQSYDAWDRFPLQQSSQLASSFQPPKSTTTLPFKRTIVVLIDALRFDFVAPTNNTNMFAYQLPILHTLSQSSNAAHLYQFRADPPTTTMQRVKGLMTGSLPTFIDAGANFASSAVSEDHLLNHIKTRYPNIYLMGDDTWVNLFPSIFHQPNRTFDSDSFKMLDLDSVDNNILTHLWPTLERDDWQFLVAHFLGVDHCGHTYGPSDPNMQRKLNQMNSVIERLLDFVDQDTLLVVMGDHGMTTEGDHGGESIEELMSTLFLYSGRSLAKPDDYFQQLSRRMHQSRANQLGYDLDSISKRLSYDAYQYPVVSQIHLVPTLAYLLQVPIPFENLGALIPDVLPLVHPKTGLLLHMVEQLRINALQVYDYLEQYASSTRQIDFSLVKLNPLKQHLYRAESIMLGLFQGHNEQQLDTNEDDRQQLEEALFAYDAFLISTMKYCESIWAQFDTGCMILGIALLGVSLIMTLILVIQHGFKASVLSLCLTLGSTLIIGLLVTYARYTLLDDLVIQQGWFEKMERTDWVGAILALILCSLVLHVRLDRQQIQQSVFWRNMDWPMILLISIIQASSLGSNSFVVWEDRSTVFILATLCFIWMMRNLASISLWHALPVAQAMGAPMGFFLLVRLTSMTGQCREEQSPYCDYFHSGQLIFERSEKGYVSFALLIVTFTLLVHFGAMLGRTVNMVVGGSYHVSSIIVFYRTVYEVFARMLDTGAEEKSELAYMIQKYIDIYLPRVVYGLFLLGLVLTCLQFRSKLSSARFHWTLLVLMTPVLSLLQRPIASTILLGAPMLIDLLCQGSDDSLLIRLALLHFLGHHLFFVTGHQVTSTSLPWKAAFVGFEEMHYYTGMILVTLSTLSGYLLTWTGWSVLLKGVQEKHKEVPKHSLYLLILLQSIPSFLCAVFVFILRRHLMTWKIFAPRFLFQVLLQIGAHIAAVVLEKCL
ncbi:hypothetical protein BD560DRAFT_405948 [Blakeslea trispora]|nr:hypothetical protein BD560DRAFT_405948 [Blakeslea trispora]